MFVDEVHISPKPDYRELCRKRYAKRKYDIYTRDNVYVPSSPPFAPQDLSGVNPWKYA